MSFDEDFISRVVTAFHKTIEETKKVPSREGMERQFRHYLAQFLFGDVLGWKGHYLIAEILDITCFDDEKFPIIVVETKYGVELNSEIKEKLRRRIEELGSVKYGVFASEREFVVYVYEDYTLRDITHVNVAEAIGVAEGKYGFPETKRRRVLKLELLKRDRLVWVEDPDYFAKTYKEISLAKREGVELLTENLKGTVRDLTTVLMSFFNSYRKRKDHYSGRFLEKTFNDWLKLSMKDAEFEKGNQTSRKDIIEIFCRETAYVLLGRVLFTRMCEDKDIMENMISGKGIVESLAYYGKRRIGKLYLYLFNESREEIKRYYGHLHELGFFDWWLIEKIQRGTLSSDYTEIQENLEKDLDYSIKKAFRRLNRFDFAQVNRDILGDVYQRYLPPDERKRLGEFYTPKEVIEYILDAVGYKPENEIRGKKILDPACGSGSFLVEATQRLTERYRRVGFDINNPDDAKQIIDGCIHSINGLDIHPFACFITEMNLLFQLIELYDVVRQKYRYYEVPRLNIYRIDSLVPSGQPIELTEFFDNSRRRMLIEEAKGADKIKSIKFEFVVGNPPYVRKERIATDYKEKILKTTYPEVYHGDNDICVYFVVRGIKWLKEDGKFAYIVSGKFTKARYGGRLREYLPAKCSIDQFLDFRGVKVFREATNDPIILVLHRETVNEKRSMQQIKVVKVKQEMETARELVQHIRQKIKEKRYSGDYVDVFELKQSLLGKVAWKLTPRETRTIFDKIQAVADFLLKDLCDTYFGVKTGRNEIFVVDEKTVSEFQLEKELLKPVLRGEDVRRYVINYENKFLIFPYVKEEANGKVRYEVIDVEEYPNLFRYLTPHKEDLANRYDIKKSKSKWYELRACDYYDVFESEKIITPDISERNNFAYDEGKYYCLNTCYVISLKADIEKRGKNSKTYLKYLLGLLNSEVLEFYFKHIATYLGKKGYRYFKGYLEQIPIREFSDENSTNQVYQKVDEILRFDEQSRSAKERIKGFPNSYFEENWSFDKPMNIAKVHLSKSSYNISEKTIRTYPFKELESPFREVFRIILATKEYIDFYSEEVASYVLEVLKTTSRITRRELLELKIPAQNHLKTLMQQYKKDNEQILKNEKAVKELEKQIDDLVYKLYDIAPKERRLIEEYLTKF